MIPALPPNKFILSLTKPMDDDNVTADRAMAESHNEGDRWSAVEGNLLCFKWAVQWMFAAT